MTEAVRPPAAVEARLGEMGTADVLIGIASFNNARTIGHVVRAAAAGLAKHFPAARGVIVNSDGGSKDGVGRQVTLSSVHGPAPEDKPDSLRHL